MDKIKDLILKKELRHLFYVLFTSIMIFFLFTLGQLTQVNKFLESIELKTLDFRFAIPNKKMATNPKIVILTIDDNSLEFLEEEFGRWPWSRNVYTKMIDYLEQDKVGQVIFDLMFLGYQKGLENKDIELAKTMGNYHNIYTSMNFDSRMDKIAPPLPSYMKINVENKSSNINLSDLEYSNVRLILPEIIKYNKNIGMINLSRDVDGISRRCPIFLKYNNTFYPYLAFKAAIDNIKQNENIKINKFIIDKNNDVLIGSKKIHLDKDGKMIINWYGANHSFEYIPFYKIIKSINNIKAGKPPVIQPGYFKDKVVFVGVTATSLFDIKSTPLSNIYPGVEVQATVYNNILDRNSVRKFGDLSNLLICMVLGVLTSLIVIRIRSSFFSSFATIMLALIYIGFASYLLRYHFIWIGMINQIIIMTLTFTSMFIIKYLLKSRDFEYTYKLATTDGLTGLHNHRFFQEHMVNSLDRGKRYKSSFSLLLVDIDFFKKFNDTYGHQAGDAVLRQVADTLKKMVRASDLVARYGGEEMTIVLDNTNINEAMLIADKICKQVAFKPYRLSEGIERHVTISIGVSTYPFHGETSAELIEYADRGLYRAKENGRNQVGSLEEDDEILIEDK
ncbi:MAG: diguanylate cyclase [bacterium]